MVHRVIFMERSRGEYRTQIDPADAHLFQIIQMRQHPLEITTIPSLVDHIGNRPADSARIIPKMPRFPLRQHPSTLDLFDGCGINRLLPCNRCALSLTGVIPLVFIGKTLREDLVPHKPSAPLRSEPVKACVRCRLYRDLF